MIQLRDYQIEAVNTIWARLKMSSSVLCVMATGGGKTEVMIEVLKKALSVKPDLKAVVLVQKITLLKQTIIRFKEQIDSVSIYCGTEGENDLSGSVVIATIQSIYDKKIDGLNLIILDECHNVDQDEGRYSNFFSSNTHDRLKILGFTATPYRADGYIYGEGKLFEQIDFEMGLRDLISKGFLVPPLLKKPDHQIDTSNFKISMGEWASKDVQAATENEHIIDLQVKDALARMTGRNKIAWACSSIDHSEMVLSKLVELNENGSIIHSQMSMEERLDNQNRFEYGLNRHLVFVTIVSEGYDYPPIDCIVFLRPTRSPVLYVQTVGRGLRISEGKKDCLVLDYGKVIENVGPIDDPNIKKQKYERINAGEIKKKTKVCPQCREYNLIQTQYCIACEYQFFEIKAKELKPELAASLFRKDEEIQIAGIKMLEHKSKNGNNCLRITYIPTNILNKQIDEYFVFSNEWAYKKMQRRLFDLKVPTMPSIKEIIEQSKSAVAPKSITVRMKDGYKNIIGMRF